MSAQASVKEMGLVRLRDSPDLEEFGIVFVVIEVLIKNEGKNQ